nr:hypothetical protein BaRGS_034216 [Batillaria attramentaria]
MLGTMSSLGAGRDSASPLPLALALTPREAHSHHRHNHHHHHHPAHPHHALSYDPIRRLALARLPPPRRPASGNNNKPFTSFCIKDILGGDVDREESSRLSETTSSGTSTKTKAANGGSSKNGSNNNNSSSGGSSGRSGSNGIHRPRPSPTSPPCTLPVPSSTSPKVQIPAVSLNGARIVRPWAPSPGSPETEISSDDGVDPYHDHMHDNDDDDEEEEISVDDDEPSPRQRAKGGKSGVSPLDALMAMTSKTFEGLEAPDSADARRRDQAALFGKHAPPKKRRKSRTAFTNQQIYELEKRFLYQKYLTPADRDEIAHTLGLTNAQVITWFQNRRAKLKRDLEELKNDVTAARKHPVHKTLMGTVAELQLRKVHEEVLQKAAAAAAAGAEASGNGGRKEERRGQGEAFTPPPSPCSLSAPVTSPSMTSPSPNPPLSVSGGMSPGSGSCHSNNSSDVNLSPGSVCNLSASNNNNSRGHRDNINTTDACDEPDDDEGAAAGSVNTDNECVSGRVSPAVSPGPERRVSPAVSPRADERCPEHEENDKEEEGHADNEVEEEMDVDVTDEEEKPSAASPHNT